jgi:hypothetical protein
VRLQKLGGRVHSIICDVSLREQANRATAATLSEFGRIDGCFANRRIRSKFTQLTVKCNICDRRACSEDEAADPDVRLASLQHTPGCATRTVVPTPLTFGRISTHTLEEYASIGSNFALETKSLSEHEHHEVA